MSGFSGGASVIPEITQGMIMEALGWDFSRDPGYRVIWIDTENGDDTGGNGSRLNPFKSYARAIQEVPPIIKDITTIIFTHNSEVDEDIVFTNRILMAGAYVQIFGADEFGNPPEEPIVPVYGDIIISGIVAGGKAHGTQVLVGGFKHSGGTGIMVIGSDGGYITACERIRDNGEPLVIFYDSSGYVGTCNFDNTPYGVRASRSTVFIGPDNTGTPLSGGVFLIESILYRMPGTIPGNPEIITTGMTNWYAVFDLLEG